MQLSSGCKGRGFLLKQQEKFTSFYTNPPYLTVIKSFVTQKRLNSLSGLEGLFAFQKVAMQDVTPKVVRIAVMEDPLPSSPFMGRS